MWYVWAILIFSFLVLTLLICTGVTRSTYEGDGSFPKIIHQTAPADESKWPPIWKPCQESWKKNFPDYEYRMWTDEDLDEFIKTKYAWFYPTYMGYPKKINRIDAARYFILYEYGGIYADMDYECVKNFEHLIPKGKACAAESPHPVEKYQNALMISPAKHVFWTHTWKDLEKHKSLTDVLYCTGPEVIHRTANKYPELFKGLPKTVFAQPHDETFQHAIAANKYIDVLPPAPEWVYSRHFGTAVWT